MALTEPDFIECDADKITREMIAKYEAGSGKKLYPAQAERLLIDLFAYRENVVRVAIQEAAKQNLVTFARAPMLDYLGELVGTFRLPAQAAKTTLEFSVDTPLIQGVSIPAGIRASASDSVLFATDEEITLPAGVQAVTVMATCTAEGVAGNGWQPAQISALLDSVGDIDLHVTNVTVSAGGCDEESDDQLRERIKLAPESYSNAGSYGAYRYLVRSVHQSIIDVAVLGVDEGVPEGHVELYPLTADGLPSEELLAMVEASVSSQKKRPLTDKVSAKAARRIEYQVRARLTLYTSTDPGAALAAAHQAISLWVSEKRQRLGGDIVPNQIIKVLQVTGVYDVELEMPAKQELALHEWADCTDINITIAGVSDG